MLKLKLSDEDLFDFYVIGISSPEKDYRFCWALSQYSGMHFSRVDDIVVQDHQQKEISRHPYFEYVDDASFKTYHLLGNKTASAKFFPELDTADYIMILRGDFDAAAIAEILQKLNDSGVVFMAEEVDIHRIKSDNKELLVI